MMKTYLAVNWGTSSEDVQKECRRYAGVDSAFRYDGEWFLYQCPKGLLQKPWMASNIARMATFGIVAKVTKLESEGK